MSIQRIAAIGVAVLGVLLAAWLLWPKKPLDDEALIRAAIAEMAEQAGERNVSGIVEHVSESYQGEAGNKRDLKAYLLGYLMQSGAVAAVPARVDVKLEGAQAAQVSLVVLLARTPAKKAEEIGPEQLVGTHRIEARFAKEAGVWKVVDATRRDATPGDLLR